MRSRRLTIGLFSALLFCAANLYSYYKMPAYSTIDDGFVSFGWPFRIYVEGGFVGQRVIIWTGLIGNVVLAICVAEIPVIISRKFLKRTVK
jgi:hypothetical protein